MDETNTTAVSNPSYAVPASIIAAGVIIAVAVIYSSGSTVPSGAGSAQVGQIAEDEKVAPSDAGGLLEVRAGDFILGNPAAPVTVFEFADFQCPFCGKFANSSIKELKEKYIKTGQAKLVWRDFAFLGQESLDAASAARCAGEQGKFWDYHDYLFTHQSGENRGTFSAANLKKFAGEIKLDQAKFDECLDSKKYEEAVKSDTDNATQLGVNGTPTTFVGSKSLVGAQPFAQLESLVKSALQ